MQVLAVLLLAVLALCEGFSLGTRGSTSHALKMSADVVDRLVVKVANSKLLTKTAQLGLLSKLDKAGVKLTTLGPLIKQAEKLGALSLIEGKADKLLPLLNTAVDLAPALLPVAKGALSAGPTPFLLLAVASFVSALAVVGVIPDDSVSNVALQTLLAVPLGAIVPGACVVGAGVLSKLK